MIELEVQEQIIRILGQLETYLINANKLDWIGLLGIIASFIISAIAIYISIQTARKQNAIVLFEKRYMIYDTLIKFNKTFGGVFNENIKSQINIQQLPQIYNSILTNCIKKEKNIEILDENNDMDSLNAVNYIEFIEKTMLMSEFLYNKQIYEAICCFFKPLSGYTTELLFSESLPYLGKAEKDQEIVEFHLKLMERYSDVISNIELMKKQLSLK